MIKEILYWVIVALIAVTIWSLIVGCNILQPTASTDLQLPNLPSSPAVQMWKVVAKTNWVVTLCLLGFGGGVFAYANGMTKLGLSVILSCVATLFFGLAIHRFPTWMAVIGLIGSIAAAAASLLMKNRALVEVIKGGQAFKKQVEEDVGINLNAGEARIVKQRFVNKHEQKQSPITQKLVKKIKGNLRLKGEI